MNLAGDKNFMERSICADRNRRVSGTIFHENNRVVGKRRAECNLSVLKRTLCL